jgi:hypothetical protein
MPNLENQRQIFQRLLVLLILDQCHLHIYDREATSRHFGVRQVLQPEFLAIKKFQFVGHTIETAKASAARGSTTA